MKKLTKKKLQMQLDGVQNRFAALVKYLKPSGHICESVYAPFAYDYQNSLIERERKELTGSELTKGILNNQFMQACLVSDSSDKAALEGDDLQLIRMYRDSEGSFISMRDPWHGCHHKYAVAVDNNRKPLTVKEAGL